MDPDNYEKGKEPYYPVNDAKNTEMVNRYRELAKQYPNVIFGGRLREYKYYDMDKVIASALSVTDALFEGE